MSMNDQLKRDLFQVAGWIEADGQICAADAAASVQKTVESLLSEITAPIPTRVVLFCTILARHADVVVPT